MPLSKALDTPILNRFDELISDGEILIKQMDADNRIYHSTPKYLGDTRVTFLGSVHHQETNYESLVTRATSLVQIVLAGTQRGQQIVDDIRRMKIEKTSTQRSIGILKGLKDDYSNGMLDELYKVLESNIASDYMGQAEQLLGENVAGQYSHVPSAVLAGAVLEDALRRLCQRQTPPIDTLKPNGEKKTLDPLITDLQKVNAFNKAKAEQLKSWAKIRNYAAHGEFTEFNRTDVEAMVSGIQTFIGDYL
jgi:hypothetical protein